MVWIIATSSLDALSAFGNVRAQSSFLKMQIGEDGGVFSD